MFIETGDRIMALTVCFDSIVYEDALTILSYASPYPVELPSDRKIEEDCSMCCRSFFVYNVHRMRRKFISSRKNDRQQSIYRIKSNGEMISNIMIMKVNKSMQTFPIPNWFFSLGSRSYVQPSRPPPPPITTALPILTPKLPSSPKTSRLPAKKITATTTQSRSMNRSATTTAAKGNKIKTSSNSILATSGATSKRMTNDVKRYRTKASLPRSNPPITTSTMPAVKSSIKTAASPLATNKKPVKSVTDAVMSYLHYKGTGGEPSSGRINHHRTTD